MTTRQLTCLCACWAAACSTPEVMIAKERPTSVAGAPQQPATANCVGTTSLGGADGGPVRNLTAGGGAGGPANLTAGAGGKVCGVVARAGSAAAVGGWAGACASDCTQCVLEGRPDILPVFAAENWDTTCESWDQILSNWCAPTMDYVGCALEKAGRCSSACECGSPCTQCLLAQGPTTLRAYLKSVATVVCDSADVLVANWCTDEAAACAELKQSACCPFCR